MGDVRLLNAKKFAFGFLAIHHEAALECVTGAFDVSQKRGKKASGATLCRRQHQVAVARRSEEHTSELQSLMRISYAVFCLKKKTTTTIITLNTLQLLNQC